MAVLITSSHCASKSDGNYNDAITLVRKLRTKSIVQPPNLGRLSDSSKILSDLLCLQNRRERQAKVEPLIAPVAPSVIASITSYSSILEALAALDTVKLVGEYPKFWLSRPLPRRPIRP